MKSIVVHNLGKQYALGRPSGRYRTLRDTLADSLARRRRRTGKRERNSEPEVLWALRDVSLEIGQGEVVGIIGRNGAGKSTLLKILARITSPTTGYAEIRGRVGSLLEVGSGFHQELTGRENIYLSAAILGMKRTEIDRKFDEIVAFSAVERFLDTPVKHYSSGMYLRLAFAVAAHLEPEILLVDEVLAVGDAEFQKKCLNKMQGVGRAGRTVLFVSHNLPAVTRLCERTVLLDGGRVTADGPSHRIVSAYLNGGAGTMAVREWLDDGQAPGGEVVRLRSVRVRTRSGRVTDSVQICEPVGIEMAYEVLVPGYLLSPYITLSTDRGAVAFSSVDLDESWRRTPRPAGRYVSTAWVPGNFLNEGTFFVEVGAAVMKPLIMQFRERDVVAFRVHDVQGPDSTTRGDWPGGWEGALRPRLEWTTAFDEKGLP